MADAADSKSAGVRLRVGSSPTSGTFIIFKSSFKILFLTTLFLKGNRFKRFSLQPVKAATR